MLLLARAVLYGTAFLALVLVYLPARTLAWAGVAAPAEAGPAQWAGGTLVLLGFLPMLSSLHRFVFRGRGTAAPFDPPKELVVDGPYRYVRNPMYLGCAVSLVGVTAYHASPWPLAVLGVFLVWAHLFVRHFEEPRLRRTFGHAYHDYCARVPRWLPARPKPD